MTALFSTISRAEFDRFLQLRQGDRIESAASLLAEQLSALNHLLTRDPHSPLVGRQLREAERIAHALAEKIAAREESLWELDLLLDEVGAAAEEGGELSEN